MITIRCVVGTPPSSEGVHEPSLIEIDRSLKAVEERLAALAPQTRLAEPHVRELREIRLLVAAIITDVVPLPRPSPGSSSATRRS
jgi:hypothetical protein